MNAVNPTTRRAGRKSNAQKAAEAAAAAAAQGIVEVGELPPMAETATVQSEGVQMRTERARSEVRQTARDPARDTLRPINGVYYDENGVPLTRSRPSAGTEDLMEIPANEIPEGWEYQWNTMTVYNEPMTSEVNNMWANGWRPVPAERHPGRIMPLGHKGEIIHKGARLEMRPKYLSDEARAEDMRKALALRGEQNAMMMAKGRMGDLAPGMSMDGQRYRGVSPNLRTSIGPEGEAPRPGYERE